MFINLAFEFGCDVIFMSHPITRSLGSKLRWTLIFAIRYPFFTNQTGVVWWHKTPCGLRKLTAAFVSKIGLSHGFLDRQISAPKWRNFHFQFSKFYDPENESLFKSSWWIFMFQNVNIIVYIWSPNLAMCAIVKIGGCTQLMNGSLVVLLPSQYMQFHKEQTSTRPLFSSACIISVIINLNTCNSKQAWKWLRLVNVSVRTRQNFQARAWGHKFSSEAMHVYMGRHGWK